MKKSKYVHIQLKEKRYSALKIEEKKDNVYIFFIKLDYHISLHKNEKRCKKLNSVDNIVVTSKNEKSSIGSVWDEYREGIKKGHSKYYLNECLKKYHKGGYFIAGKTIKINNFSSVENKNNVFCVKAKKLNPELIILLSTKSNPVTKRFKNRLGIIFGELVFILK